MLSTNDIVLHLLRDGAIVASQDTVFSPEALVYWGIGKGLIGTATRVVVTRMSARAPGRSRP